MQTKSKHTPEIDEEGRDVTGINDEINFPLGPGALPEILRQRDALADALHVLTDDMEGRANQEQAEGGNHFIHPILVDDYIMARAALAKAGR